MAHCTEAVDALKSHHRKKLNRGSTSNAGSTPTDRAQTNPPGMSDSELRNPSPETTPGGCLNIVSSRTERPRLAESELRERSPLLARKLGDEKVIKQREMGGNVRTWLHCASFRDSRGVDDCRKPQNRMQQPHAAGPGRKS